MDTSLSEHERTFKEGNFIFTEEGEGETFYIIKSGKVSLLKNTEDGGVSQIGMLSEGDVLGEMALIDEDDHRSASARALTDVTCLEFQDEQFDQLLKNSEEFRQTVMDLLSGRLRNTSENLADVLNLRDKIHEATVLLLYFFHDNGWLDRSRKEVPTDLPVETLSSYFRVSEEKIDDVLKNPEAEDLRDYALDKRNEVLDTSEQLLEHILDTISFEPGLSEPGSDESGGSEVDQPDAKTLAEELKDFREEIQSTSGSMDDEVREKALNRLDDYEDQFRRCMDESREEEVLSEIQSTIDLIRDELNAER